MEKLLRYFGKDLQDITMDSWLKSKPTALHSMALKWFEEIKQCSDEVQPIFHDGYPIGCVDHAPFAYVNIFTSHVNVGFFYGAALPDPGGILEGTGKQGRHVKLMPGTAHDDKAIEALIAASYHDILKRLMNAE